jgi:mono/diheme cytochrome c family protein
MSRRALILAGLLGSVAAFAVAGCGSKGTVAPVPNTVEGSVPKTTTTTTTSTGPALKGDPAAGKTVFASAGCSACHTLKAANATGTVGPNLDNAKPAEALVVDRVTNGKGVMPSFKGKLSPQQIADVAAFVSQSAGG